MAQRILIVGGGFGGVYTARHLRRLCPKDTHIELINDKNYFVFQPLLPEVASGVINAQDAVSPLRALLRGIHFRQAEVKRINFADRCVQVLQGQKHRLIEVPCDHLVLATGLQPNLSFAPGLAEHSLTIKDLSDAFHLRNQVIECLEWADVTSNPDLKQRALTFVIAGGGFSGVETMGEIHDLIRRTLRYYPNISREEVRCVLIQGGDRLLQELPEKLGQYAEKELSRRGITVLLNCRIASASSRWVRYAEADGVERTLDAMTLVTTVGNGPTELCATQNDLPLERGRIRTDAFLRAEGRDNIWALGDAACVAAAEDGSPAPPTAQFAVQQAATLAHNLATALSGKGQMREFSYQSLGAMASLGSYRGVAQVMGIRLTGLLAWFVWRGFYILRLPGFVAKLRVTLNWLLDYVVPRTIVKVQQLPPRAARFAYYGAGDVLFEPGELLDGMYLVLSGKLEVRVGQGGKELVKTVGPQERIGDRITSYDTPVLGEVRAVEDTRVLFIGWTDLVHLRNSSEQLDAFLQEASKGKYPEEIYGSLPTVDDGEKPAPAAAKKPAARKGRKGGKYPEEIYGSLPTADDGGKPAPAAAKKPAAHKGRKGGSRNR